MPVTHWNQLATDACLLDVRSTDEYSNDGHVVGAVNIPLNELRNHLFELPKDHTLYTYCLVG